MDPQMVTLTSGLKSEPPQSEELRHERAVEALEYMATPAAKELLQAFAKESSYPVLAQEAKAALERLAKLPPAP